MEPRLIVPLSDNGTQFERAEKDQRVKELEKLNSRLRGSLNRLYSSVSDGEHLSKEWIKSVLLDEPSSVIIDSLVRLRGLDTAKIKELEDKLKIAVGALKRVDNIAYEIDNEVINNIACTALEQIGELK